MGAGRRVFVGRPALDHAREELAAHREAVQVATLALKIAEMYGTPEDTLARRVGRRGPPPPELTEEEEDALAECHAQDQEERERQEAHR